MTSPSDVVLRLTCYVLVALTAWEVGRGWLRYRDRHRVDILWVVGLLAAILLFGDRAVSFGIRHPVAGFFLATLCLLQPYFLLRLVQRFRRVPEGLIQATAVIAVVGSGAAVVWHEPGGASSTVVLALYFFVQLAYAAWAFGAESRAAGGVTGARLWFASLGTWLHVVIAVVVALEAVWSPAAVVGPDVRRVLGLGVFACYYAGLVAPRALRNIWSQHELYLHVRLTAERDPDVRAREAPADLIRAIGRGVSSVARIVLLFDGRERGRLRTRAASAPMWSFLEVTPGAGLLGRCLGAGSGVSGGAEECEEAIAGLVRQTGDIVWAIPIASNERQWGVLLVIQRHGSLFPDDDLDFMEVLARDTAASLEHGRLIAIERQHEKDASESRLRATELRFDQILESIRDYAVLLLDDAGRIVAWRAGAQALFGHDARDVIGRHAAPLFARDVHAFDALLAEARASGHVSEDSLCARRDGTTFTASTTIRPVLPDVGLKGFVVVLRDETERRALGERLQQAQKMEAVGQLAGGVAHDFNNLLTAVLGYASVIQSHPGYDPALDAHLMEIRKVAERASALTRRLLAFSRRQVVQPRLVSLPEIVSDLVPMLERVLEDRVTLDFHAESEEGLLLADPVQIEQIVLNLAVNARDAMPDGGTLVIRTGVTTLDGSKRTGDTMLPEGSYALLTVTDTGTGMDVGTRERMFEPFFTTKDVGRGTGLGLSTVYGIVKQIGGGIDVETAVGRGTTFYIFFPALSAEAILAGDTGESPHSEIDAPGETVLVVEDDDAIRPLLVGWLERAGYTAIVARGGDEARAAMRGRDDVRLIVSDVMMPGEKGPALVAALTHDRPDVSALYVSGYAHDTLTTQGHLPSGTHFLSKPFSEQAFLTAVRQAIQPQRSLTPSEGTPGRAQKSEVTPDFAPVRRPTRIDP